MRSALPHRAGRLTRARGKLTLTVSAGTWIEEGLLHYLAALQPTA